ncbi:MAG: M48 family metallopeptidase [Bacteroidetes bacterium]|nr:M48 family metallopeptidase [Bacteroidota bacterium]
MTFRFKVYASMALLLIFAACSTVAVTGRKQLLLISGDEINALAADQYKEVISKSKLSPDASKTEMVKRVGTKIQKAVEAYMASKGNAKALDGFKWEYNLIEDDKTVNAWCMPGGKVAFYTAILPICTDEMGVAVVMGHEVAHAIANHGAERMSEALVAQVGMEAVGTAIGKDPAMSKQLLLQAVGAGTSLGLLKFSRKHESEADHMGLIFMAMAGYDPRQAPEFWKRMAAIKGGAAPPEFLSTHPSDERRIADINKIMPEALKYYQQP